MESNPPVKLLGVYQVSEAPDVHLFELLINASPKEVDVSVFTQKDDTLPKSSWQTAYDEHYLSEDGTRVIFRGYLDSYSSVPRVVTRIAFFMYFVDFNKPLESQYGEITLSSPSSMPERLSEIIEFNPD